MDDGGLVPERPTTIKAKHMWTPRLAKGWVDYLEGMSSLNILQKCTLGQHLYRQPISTNNSNDLETEDNGYPVSISPDCETHRVLLQMSILPIPHSYSIVVISLLKDRTLAQAKLRMSRIREQVIYFSSNQHPNTSLHSN